MNPVFSIYTKYFIVPDEVIHIAAIPFAVHNHILKIKFSRFGK